MAGTVAVVGVVGVTAVLAVTLVTAGAAHVHTQRLAGVADAAALAAADAASGAILGIPCERAAQVTVVEDMILAGCEVDGLIATVTVEAAFAGLPAGAKARAGPPSP